MNRQTDRETDGRTDGTDEWISVRLLFAHSGECIHVRTHVCFNSHTCRVVEGWRWVVPARVSHVQMPAHMHTHTETRHVGSHASSVSDRQRNGYVSVLLAYSSNQ
mmetsp:Transcript_35730/g.88955  ORF Transcript_35730/g.88955 Transcript_35730/m.88955 type:complete len:105 (-) Transcript_35730:788-1102(-)